MESNESIRFTPEELQAELDLKPDPYYDRLKYLQIKAKKDEEKKAYLEEPEANRLRALHKWMQQTGSKKGFLDHEREQQQGWDGSEDESEDGSQEESKAGELAVSNGDRNITQSQPNGNDDEIAAAISGQKTDRKTLQEFDRLAQKSAAAALLEARGILTGEYIADPNKLDEDLQKQVFFEENPQELNRAWAGRNLAEAIKAQKNRS